MVYLCAIPQRIPGARRIIPPTDWATFRTMLEKRYPVKVVVEFVEGRPGRAPGWFFRADPRPDCRIPEKARRVLFQTISMKLDQFLGAHERPVPQPA